MSHNIVSGDDFTSSAKCACDDPLYPFCWEEDSFCYTSETNTNWSASVCPGNCTVSDTTIHFALLLPTSGSWPGGPWVAGAAALAVERVNADKALLPGHNLEFSWANSGCSKKQGLAAMGELFERWLSGNIPDIDAVIGPGCSSACEVTSYLSAGWGIPQLSYSCTHACM